MSDEVVIATGGVGAACAPAAWAGATRETAADLIAGRKRYAASGEINSTVNDPDAVLADIAARAEAGEFGAGDVDRFDGVSLQGADFWFNVRKSNTEPLVRFNCETPDPQRTRALTTAGLARVRA